MPGFLRGAEYPVGNIEAFLTCKTTEQNEATHHGRA